MPTPRSDLPDGWRLHPASWWNGAIGVDYAWDENGDIRRRRRGLYLPEEWSRYVVEFGFTLPAPGERVGCDLPEGVPDVRGTRDAG